MYDPKTLQDQLFQVRLAKAQASGMSALEELENEIQEKIDTHAAGIESIKETFGFNPFGKETR